MMDGGNDAFRVLGWGLRKYAWLVAACILALGVLVPSLLNRVPEEYEAQAQVGPTESLKLPNLTPLPKLGQSVFNNGVVADAVRNSVNPPLRRSVAVIPDRVELVAAQDDIVFTVVGRGSTPRTAQRLANVAAAQFTEELNKYAQAVGSFAVQNFAAPPTRPVPKIGGPLAVGIGLLAGFAVGVGLVGLVLVWRRPVVDAVTAQTTTGAPVFGRVRLASSLERTRGLQQLSRRLLSDPTALLLVVGPRNTRHDRGLLSSDLATVLGWTRAVSMGAHRSKTAGSEYATDQGELVIIDGPTPLEVATRPERSLTLLVVREGVAQASLRRQAEQYLDGGNAGVVLVRRSRWNPRWWMARMRGVRRTPAASPPPPAASPESAA